MQIDGIDMPEMLSMPDKLVPMLTKVNDYELFLAEGGRGSGKSHTIARILLYLGEQRKLRIVCGREIQANIEESVYTLLKDLIDKYDLAYTVMAHKIIHKWSGTVFTFKGFREQGNVSVKGLEGVDILWIDEAQSITKNTLDVIMPTMRKDTVKVYFTMNRFLREDAVPTYCANRKEALQIQVNYYENPFCPQILKNQAAEMKARSIKDYEHIWLGKPIAAADDYLMNFDKLHEALKTLPFGEIFTRQRVLGVDFAAQGNDLCVATILDRKSNQHWKLIERFPWDEPDTMISVGKVVSMIGDFKPDVTIIDIGGMGKPVFDRISEVFAGTNVSIIPFDGGTTDGIDTKSYGNKRAAGYYALKEWFDLGYLCVDEKDKEVINELEKIKMKYRSSGSRLIQSKVDMKKPPPVGVGFSPDNADSLMMAVWAAIHHVGAAKAGAANSNAGKGSDKVVRKSSSRRKRR